MSSSSISDNTINDGPYMLSLGFDPLPDVVSVYGTPQLVPKPKPLPLPLLKPLPKFPPKRPYKDTTSLIIPVCHHPKNQRDGLETVDTRIWSTSHWFELRQKLGR